MDTHSLGAVIQKKLTRASGGLPVANLRPMKDIVGESMAHTDFDVLLLAIFAGSAMLLATIGMYALIANSVEQRMQEMGIRMALGAERSGIQRMILLQGLKLAMIGVIIGVAAAFGLSRFLASLLFGVRPWDPIIFVTIPAFLTLVAVLATWLPAHRASQVSPLQALRNE
jgi:ABC-type antimicrobial peptide transport system permease subunit